LNQKSETNWLKTMKINVLFVLIICVVLVSCGPKTAPPNEPQFKPTQNGFGVMAQWVGVDTGPGAGLYYKGTNETPVQVWPYIGTHGYPILYTNDIALLLADKPDEQGRLVNCVLVVVHGDEPAMDISDDVLKIAAEQNHVDFYRALKVCEPLRLNQAENGIKIYILAEKYKDPTISDLEVQISWEQVFDIMRDVKSSGTTNKVINTDVLYLKKDYSH
jgi:hypothetical protein